MNLNIGCGADPWGDIRLDIARKYHKVTTTANLYASAEVLPFKDRCFLKVRARHVLEHLSHWNDAVQEWCRVTREELEIEVPVDAGFVRREIYQEILSLSPSIISGLYILPLRRREHLWKLTPEVIISQLKKHGFTAKSNVIKAPLMCFSAYGRKSRFFLFKKINEKTQINTAYRIIGKKITSEH